MTAVNAPLVVAELFSACVWVGSLVCLAVVANVARKVLDGPAQAAFFRVVGRRYAIVGTTSLVVAIAAGLAMAWPPARWSATMAAAVALSGVLVVATAAGMTQARMMGRLRQRAIQDPVDDRAGRALRGGRRVATALRALMGAVTLSIVVLVALVISH